MRTRTGATACVLLACFIVMLVLSVGAQAQKSDEDRVEFGHNINVAAGQTSGDISCFNCSVYVSGHANGDIAVFGGRVVVEGSVKGDIAVFWGTVRLEDGAQVGGDVAVFGGPIKRAPTVAIHGNTVAFGRIWVLLPVVILVVVLWLIIALIVWLVTRNRRPPLPVQTSRPT
jgi:uncharacterized membrane protein